MRAKLLSVFCVLLVLFPINQVQGQDIPFSDDEIIEFSRSVVQLLVQTTQDIPKQGSGVIISPDGVIFTAAHVVEGATEIRIGIFEGEGVPPDLAYIGEVDYTSDTLDFAVVKIVENINGQPINSANLILPYIQNWSSRSPTRLEDIYIWGYPTISSGLSSTSGIISNPNNRQELAETDATFAVGGSGGLIINSDGEYFGIPIYFRTDPTSSGQLTTFIPLSTLCQIEEEVCPPPGMVRVPAGDFMMGSTDAEIDAALSLCLQTFSGCERSWFIDETLSTQRIAQDFWIDKTEVTRGMYEQCVNAGACQPTPNPSYPVSDNQPITRVTWRQAQDFCEWRGARLPTDIEWEYAARGPDHLIFPWGNTFDGRNVNYCDASCSEIWADRGVNDGFGSEPAPVGSYPNGQSWVGALDMAGNVYEWVSVNGGEGLRGGSYVINPAFVRTSVRARFNDASENADWGFRCVRDN